MSGNKDRPATGCEAGVVLKFFSVSHRPWDTYRTRTTHTHTKPATRDWLDSLRQEKIDIKSNLVGAFD